MVPKLYVIVRSDLSLGQQAVQGMHAAIGFIFKHPLRALRWFLKSNTVALLSIQDEQALGVLFGEALAGSIPAAAFHEPDRGNEMTAIAMGPEGKALTQGLRTAYRHDPPPKKQPKGHHQTK
jgi:hypothetical protein